jgi:copper chaperone CopZ
MAALTVQVPDVSCGGCKATLEEAVGKVPSVVEVSVDVDAKSMHVRGVGIQDSRAVEAAIAEAGYTVGDVRPA